jgi:hypothetical protein
MFVVGLGLEAFDADEISAGTGDGESLSAAGVSAGLEVHVEGGLENDVVAEGR